MSQSRKKRIVVFEIRITVFTDYLQDFFSGMVRGTIKAMEMFAFSKGYSKTKFEIQQRVLDGKTFAEIKKYE